jgi:indole-3-glycerol phosphate synthase
VSDGFLKQMAQTSRARVAEASSALPHAQLAARLGRVPLPPALARSAAGFDLIAELKLRSPAVGQLGSAHDDIGARVMQYAQAGAAAVSVLTEPSRFDGSLEHLSSAARTLAAAGVPAMRKDFLVDPYQVLEARAAGAGGVLVIVRMLGSEVLESLIDCALQLQMFVLLETFDESDIALARTLIEARWEKYSPLLLIGVNCRDLATLQVVRGRLLELAPLLPPHVTRVAESGVASGADAAQVAAAGYDMALVGSALMSGPDPDALVREMLAAGRRARAAERF